MKRIGLWVCVAVLFIGAGCCNTDKRNKQNVFSDNLWGGAASAVSIAGADAFLFFRLTDENVMDYLSGTSLLRYPIACAPRKYTKQQIHNFLEFITSQDSYIHECVAYGCGFPKYDLMVSFWEGSERVDVFIWTATGFITLFRNQHLTGTTVLRQDRLEELREMSALLFPSNPVEEKLVAAKLSSGEDYFLSYTPLKQISLELQGTNVVELNMLAGMTLQSIKLDNTRVQDLSPLRSVQSLEKLTLYGPSIPDLTPLDGLPLRFLRIWAEAPVDISIIRTVPLESLWLDDPHLIDNIDAVRGMSTLKKLNGDPNRFWRSYDAGEYSHERNTQP